MSENTEPLKLRERCPDFICTACPFIYDSRECKEIRAEKGWSHESRNIYSGSNKMVVDLIEERSRVKGRLIALFEKSGCKFCRTRLNTDCYPCHSCIRGECHPNLEDLFELDPHFLKQVEAAFSGEEKS